MSFFQEAQTNCTCCGQKLDQLGNLMSMNFAGECLHCIAQIDGPGEVDPYRYLTTPRSVWQGTMRHSMSRADVEDLWEDLVRSGAQLIDGLWHRPPLPEWMQLLWLQATKEV